MAPSHYRSGVERAPSRRMIPRSRRLLSLRAATIAAAVGFSLKSAGQAPQALLEEGTAREMRTRPPDASSPDADAFCKVSLWRAEPSQPSRQMTELIDQLREHLGDRYRVDREAGRGGTIDPLCKPGWGNPRFKKLVTGA